MALRIQNDGRYLASHRIIFYGARSVLTMNEHSEEHVCNASFNFVFAWKSKVLCDLKLEKAAHSQSDTVTRSYLHIYFVLSGFAKKKNEENNNFRKILDFCFNANKFEIETRIRRCHTWQCVKTIITDLTNQLTKQIFFGVKSREI